MGISLKTWLMSIAILAAGAGVAGIVRAETIAPVQKSAASAPGVPAKAQLTRDESQIVKKSTLPNTQASVGELPSAKEVDERVNTAIGTAAFILVMAWMLVIWTVRTAKHVDDDFGVKYD